MVELPNELPLESLPKSWANAYLNCALDNEEQIKFVTNETIDFKEFLRKVANNRIKMTISAEVDEIEQSKLSTLRIYNEIKNFLVKLTLIEDRVYMTILVDTLDNEKGNSIRLKLTLGEITLAYDDFLNLAPGHCIELLQADFMQGQLMFPDNTVMAQVNIKWADNKPILEVKKV